MVGNALPVEAPSAEVVEIEIENESVLNLKTTAFLSAIFKGSFFRVVLFNLTPFSLLLGLVLDSSMIP